MHAYTRCHVTNNSKSWGFLHRSEGGSYQVSAIDMLACLATIKVDKKIRVVVVCFCSTQMIQPKTIAVILAFCFYLDDNSMN